MRNTPLPFFGISSVVGNKKTAEEKIQEEREKLSKTFESAKNKKESRKKAFEDEKEKAKKAKKGLKGDEKKVARYNVQRINREERKKRAEDRKQQWAEKRFLQGKYDSVDQAKKRFETMQDMTSKQNQTFQGIIGNIGGTPNDPDTDASEETYDANKATVTDASMSTDDYTKGFGSGVYGM